MAVTKKPAPKPKKYCRTVTKTVKGKKKKVKVCTTKKPVKKPAKKPLTTVKPKPTFVLAPTVPVKVPPSPELPPSSVTPVDPTPPDPTPPDPTPPDPDPDSPQLVTSPLTAAQAERLLWRAGFGPKPGQVAALTGRDPAEAIQELTRPSTVSFSGAAGTDENGFAFQPTINWGHDHCAWLDRMVRCDQPMVERIALIFHDWFGVSRGEVEPYWILPHIQMYRDKGFGTFDELLKSVAVDPAMLLFLNGTENTKNNPNENFAREVMELFTLGAERDAYTETDIRELAKALTGWRATWDTNAGDWRNFRFDANRHKTGNKTIFGQTADFGWGSIPTRSTAPAGEQDVFPILLDHPLHASFFCTKMWSYFVPVPPDSVTLANLTGIYLANNREIRPVIEAILQHPQCLNGPAMVIPPVVHAAGILRATGGRLRTDNWAWVGDLAGQRLFWPPNVSGWDDQRWLDTSKLRGRWYQAVYALDHSYIDPWPSGGSTYNPNETAQQALTSALEFVGNPTITEDGRAALLAFSNGIEALAVSNWQKSPYKAMRQNALRMLILTSPDRNVC